MKKLVYLVFLANCFASCETQKSIQGNPTIVRIYVWDIPLAENLTFKTFLPDDLRIIVGANKDGTPLYLLCPKVKYDELRTWLKDSVQGDIPAGLYAGGEFVASYVGKLSYLSNDDINKLKTDQEKNLARAFNDYEKHMLHAESPYIAFGKKNQEGNIIPLSSEELMKVLSGESKKATSSKQEAQVPTRRRDRKY